MPVTTHRVARSGYTLLELLLVLVVVGLLAALLFPVLAAARHESGLAMCTGHLRQLGQSFQLYADDWGRLPDPRQALRSVPSRSILVCPNDDGRERLASSYTFRTLVPPRLRPYWEDISLPSRTVLVVCGRHTGAELRPTHPAAAPAPFPFKLALRADGAVERLRTDRIRAVAVPGTRPRFIRFYPGEPGYELAAGGDLP